MFLFCCILCHNYFQMNRNSSLCNAIFVLNLTCRKLHFFYTFYGDFNVIVSSIVSLTLSTFHIQSQHYIHNVPSFSMNSLIETTLYMYISLHIKLAQQIQVQSPSTVPQPPPHPTPPPLCPRSRLLLDNTTQNSTQCTLILYAHLLD